MKTRRQEVVIARLRVGHAGVKQYLNRFQMAEDRECEACPLNVSETIQHYLIECPALTDARNLMIQDMYSNGITNVNLKTLLLGREDDKKKRAVMAKILIKFISDTQKTDLL